MTQASLEYLHAQITNREYESSGNVTTTARILFANGYSIVGNSVRDINGFDAVEAQAAADNNALAKLEAGVDFLLSKTA